MIGAFLILLSGLLALVAGAEFLVRGGSSLALRLRVSPLVIGLTVVAFGTSAPELAVSLRSSLAGQGDVAAGNVVGSNIFNVAFILGLSALVAPLSVHIKLIRYDIPIMLGVTLLGFYMLLDHAVSRTEGLVLVSGFMFYAFFTARVASRDDTAMEAVPGAPGIGRMLVLDGMMIIGGLAALVVGAGWFVRGAIELARMVGLSEAVIGLTIVAAGTSLPELATSVVAAFRRQTDIAVGNIVGSNIFNLLAILGIAGSVHPFAAEGIQRLDLWMMAGVAIVLLPMAVTRHTLNRWEGGVLVSGYSAYVAWLVVH